MTSSCVATLLLVSSNDDPPGALSTDHELVETWGGTTLGTVSVGQLLDQPLAPVLTILAHSDSSRVGERSRLNDPGSDEHVRVARHCPAFGPVTGADTRPLLDPHVSRSPVLLTFDESLGATITPPTDGGRIRIDDTPISKPRRVGKEELEIGVVLQLGDRVALLLHLVPPRAEAEDDLHMVGTSDAIRSVRRSIRQVATHDVPVLLRGESGTGKELVARAIHANSRRSDRPFVSVNMAALVPTTAASELFGHCKGAFTGADTGSDGFFGAANGGTLFLDEIADTPAEVQPTLLRALESGEVQRLGGGTVARDVRVIAATDADLEAATRAGRFRLPLLQRLAGYEIRLPPLRQRREDIARMLYHFLRSFLTDCGLAEKLDCEPHSAPWLPARLVARATTAHWEGNVRQLRNVARSLVIDYEDAPQIPASAVERWFPTTTPSPPSDEISDESRHREIASDAGRRPHASIGEDELLLVLRKHGFRAARAAQELGMSRTSIYAMIEASSRLKKATDLTKDDVAHALAHTGGDLAKAADRLEVSERALKLRIKQLEI